MIATKVTTLMVAMMVIGIAPVATHAQTIDIAELIEQSETIGQISAPTQEQGAAATTTIDGEYDMPTNNMLTTVGRLGSLLGPWTNVSEGPDSDANSQSDNQEEYAREDLTRPQTAAQVPTQAVSDLLGLLPAS